MIEDVIRKIEAADMILVGIGEELDSLCHIEKEEQYRKTAAKINSEESAWMLPFLKKSILQRIEKKRTGIYEGLQTILKQKIILLYPFVRMDCCVKADWIRSVLQSPAVVMTDFSVLKSAARNYIRLKKG